MKKINQDHFKETAKVFGDPQDPPFRFNYSEIPPGPSHPLTVQPFPDGVPLRELGGPLSDEELGKTTIPSRANIIERVKKMLSRDWHKTDGCDHLRGLTDYDDAYEGYVFQGAAYELINLFSITEEELK